MKIPYGRANFADIRREGMFYADKTGFIRALESALGREAQKNYLPMQPGDVPATNADTRELDAWVGFKPNTPVTEGVQRFVDWYREYYAS